MKEPSQLDLSMKEVEQTLQDLSLEDSNQAISQEIVNKILEKINAVEILAKEVKMHLNLFYDTVNAKIKELANAIDQLSLRINSRENVVENLTEKVGSNQEGRVPKCQKKKESLRLYRSFANDREKQILRHTATQLYFAIQYFFKKERLDLKLIVEVQVMHLSCNDQHNLFIVANEFSITKRFSQVVNKGNFKELLMQFYSLPNDTEGKERSGRYASKLKARVFGKELKINGTNIDDLNTAKIIGNILRESNIDFLPINYDFDRKLDKKSQENLCDIIQSGNNKIFFIEVNSYPGSRRQKRHAEEFLCDIAEYAKTLSLNIYTSIAGKKRPCIGCSGRLEAVNISNYGRYPGRFWKHTFETQSEDVAIKTLNLLRKESSHISICKDKKSKATDYDSGSDSEAETYEQMPKFTIG